MTAFAFQEPEELVEEIPPDVADRIPEEVLDQLRDGVIDKIPENVVDRLPEGVVDRIPAGLIEGASANPVLTAILIGIGVLAVVIFLWGIVKSAFKAALFAGVVGAAAWYWYFNL